ncbi:hypothetical protein [Rubritalea marina]|uniref:hypothetical protein n=1 Tax=Rubritalea marina TaxID=361055 RepID=UPI0012EA04C3|nr:hypothetical protein [Rubritalea marina]
MQQSAAAFAKAGIASDNDIDVVTRYCMDAWSKNLPVEPLHRLAVEDSNEESQYPFTIERWNMMLASLVSPVMPPAPFAGSMMTPNAFYEKHEPIYDLARSFKCPILYNEDADVIGLGSINPVTATIFAQAAHAYISGTLKISPFITCVRIGYDAWKKLNEKHFER